MKLIKNIKALSKLLTIILIITSLIVGALLSYLWVMGYYLTLEIKIPQKTSLSISDVTFSDQDTRYFNVTFFNPSYSPSAANIIKIAVKTIGDKLYNVAQTSPTLPYTLPKATNTFSGEATFQCMWNWASYTGQDIEVLASVSNGSGPTYQTKTPSVDLTITEARFNSSISVTHFNLTVQNSQDSATYVNISQIIPLTGALPLTQVSPTLPYKLDRNQTETFKCPWNWTNHMNESITITVHTVQGYTASYNVTLPPLKVEIANVVFSEFDTTHFNVTARNRKESAFVNINKITVTLENGTFDINGTALGLPYKLDQNSNKTFTCPWNWTSYRGKNVTVSIFTAQNYTVSYTNATPFPIEVTDAIFDAADTNYFNVTIYNSAFYPTYVNITNIVLTFENGTKKEINGTLMIPPLKPQPYKLDRNSTKTFTCPWNWSSYEGKNVTITVKTDKNYIAQLTQVTPKRVILTITSISFDSVNTTIFKVTVRNSALSLEDANITKITVTFENGTVKQMSNVTSPSLPYLLAHGPDSTVTFTCQWNWTEYRGKNITITIYAKKGYVAFSIYTTPPFQ